MSWKLTNVSLDPQYAMKRRTASRMEMEPVVAGIRIRLNQSTVISDESYEVNKDKISLCVSHGVLTAENSAPVVEKKVPVVEKKVEAPTPPPPPPEPKPEPDIKEVAPDLEQEPRPHKSKRGRK
jgi:hypothetical protein